MENLGTKNLETERLILRKAKASDAEMIYNNYGKEDDVSRYVVWNTHKSIEDTKMFLNRVIESYNENHSYKWVVLLKETNEIIGMITAVDIKEKYGLVELGYCFGSKYWKKGYATETLKKVIDYFFNEIKVETIYAEHIEENIGSGKVMLKSGMTFEGTLRNRIIDKKTLKPVNLLSYSITKEDYFNKNL